MSYKNSNYIPRLYPLTVLVTSLLLSIVSPVQAAETWVAEEHNVIITAYYSPLPNQTKYFLGSYQADVIFNGQGIAGADGTLVYPGMIAAPAELPFGTKIAIPDLGIVGTVHDRGGRIETGKDGSVRVDLWMGKGEEGLARSLQFGVQRFKATVYIPENIDVPDEKFDLALFPAPASVIANLPSEAQSLVTETNNPTYGDTSVLVAAIQNALDTLGYFDHPITTYYGDVTQAALAKFLRDIGRAGAGDTADKTTRETLAAHLALRDELDAPAFEEETLLQGANGRPVRILQRVLKLLGKYDGETDGIYDQKIMSIVYAFQKEKEIVLSPTETGAGIVGPQTRQALLTAWREHRIAKRGGAEAVVAEAKTADHS